MASFWSPMLSSPMGGSANVDGTLRAGALVRGGLAARGEIADGLSLSHPRR
jgi:hypothetical protein